MTMNKYRWIRVAQLLEHVAISAIALAFSLVIAGLMGLVLGLSAILAKAFPVQLAGVGAGLIFWALVSNWRIWRRRHRCPATLHDLDQYLMRLSALRDMYAMKTGDDGRCWLDLVQASRSEPYTLQELVRLELRGSIV